MPLTIVESGLINMKFNPDDWCCPLLACGFAGKLIYFAMIVRLERAHRQSCVHMPKHSEIIKYSSLGHLPPSDFEHSV